MNYWSGKRVVVTGGSGFLGGHIARRIRHDAASVIVPTRRKDLSLGLDVREGDLCDRAFCAKVMEGADAAILAAGCTGGIGLNISRHGEMFRANMEPFLPALEAARTARVGRVIVISSACVYPTDAPIPTPEGWGHVRAPEPTNSGYGWAKRMQERMARWYAREYQMDVSVARLSNLYGPGQQADPDSSHVIGALLHKALDPASELLEVWGSGKQTRSFLFVRDAVEAICRIAEMGINAEPVNVGSREETTIAGLVEMIVEATGCRKPVVYNTTRPEGYSRRLSDTSRLEKEFGYIAPTGLAEGLAETVRWMTQ